MFEVQDELVGKIKLLNVTGARANFAEMLKSTTKVVITRHGKPTKILVNYQEYVALLESAKEGRWEKGKAVA